MFAFLFFFCSDLRLASIQSVAKPIGHDLNSAKFNQFEIIISVRKRPCCENAEIVGETCTVSTLAFR